MQVAAIASFWLLASACAAAADPLDRVGAPSDVSPVDSLVSQLDLSSARRRDPLQIRPVEVHRIVVTLQRRGPSARHQEEKTRLLATFDRRNGRWNEHHPRQRLLEALHGFTRYREQQADELKRLRRMYKNVSKAQKAFLEHHVFYSSKFDRIEQDLRENQALCDDIVSHTLDFYGLDTQELHDYIRDTEAAGRGADKISVSQALKHIVRDWTDEGDYERHSPFSCLLRTLADLFSRRLGDAEEKVKILLPGAGLGRLGHEVDRLGGFEVIINEYSMQMNVVYRFLESRWRRNEQSLRPFVDSWSNQPSEALMRRKLPFPDAAIDPHAVLLMEGDFTTIFRGHEGAYDVVLTYFFIDTARNLMNYFDTIKKVLKRGGYWVNLGPFLYGTGPFVQLTLEEVVKVTEAMGFQYLDTDERCGGLTFQNSTVRSIEAIYGFDKEALTKNAYNAQFWVARRK